MRYRKLKLFWNIIWFLVVTIGCKNNPKILYKSKEYTLYSDKVVQGKYEAEAVSSKHLISTYHDTENDNYSRLITFKFSINEKDNEMLSGVDHWLIIGNEHQSPIIQFGKSDGPVPLKPGTKLPVNYKYTFRVNMNEVLTQLKEKGYYETFNGARIAKNDFKAVYIAGGSKPLTWDFSNLQENNLELKDPDGDGIYELAVILNPSVANSKKTKEWHLSNNIASKPSYKSDQKIVDALFNLSLEEALENIEPDSTFRTGAKWGGVWTRDVSYSTILAFAYHEPKVAEISLMKKVERGRIIQDTGSGGAWPVSSDRTIWAVAAWEIYKVTGDKQWLRQVYPIIKNTLDDDNKTLRSETSGMFKGESSFLDWREQTYPKWMSNKDIYMSENLGTNAVHYRAHIILAKMAKILGEPADRYIQTANGIKESINRYLWMKDKGYYGQYLYGRNALNLSPRFEALGESLSILFDVADKERADSIMADSPITPFGTTCIFPQIPGIAPYHNNAIWPFVQAYWNLAAAKVGNERVLNQGLASIYRAGALFLTNYENFVAQTGDYFGTAINSNRMLWSMAGNLAMVYRIFMGMSFEPDGIKFQPVIPKTYSGTKTLSNFKYRNAILDITVHGFGNNISSIRMDGSPMIDAFFAGTTSGKHSIEIVMKNNDFSSGDINLVTNKFSLPTPHVNVNGSRLSWRKEAGAKSYLLYKNGVPISTDKNLVEMDNVLTEYKVVAVDKTGTESFCSEPILKYPKRTEKIFEMEDFVPKSNLPYTNFSGRGFVEISTSKNKEISIPIKVSSSGKYRIDFRYSNGTGPWNTDNNCGIRSLYVNEEYKGVLIFPQRGKDEWSNWDYSNYHIIDLHNGLNKIKVIFEDWNTNMDIKINMAMLDYFRLIKLD